MTGKRPEDVTIEERQAAKTLNFGAVYGQGAKGLVAAAWDKLDIVLPLEEAERWGQALKETYPQLTAWKAEHAASLRGGRTHCHWPRRRARDWAALPPIVGA